MLNSTNGEDRGVKNFLDLKDYHKKVVKLCNEMSRKRYMIIEWNILRQPHISTSCALGANALTN